MYSQIIKGEHSVIFCIKISISSEEHAQMGHHQIFWYASHCKYYKRNSIHWSVSDHPMKGEETREIKVRRMAL